MEATLRLDEIDIIDPRIYVERGYPHEEWTLLRREAPVYWFDRTEGERFWAITKHADITFISTRTDLFVSAPLIAVETTPLSGRRDYVRNLAQFDPPKHKVHRQVVSDRFTPRAIEALRGRVERITHRVIDGLFAEGDEGECDFVEKIAAPIPIAVITELLGVPDADKFKLLHWSNRLVASRDPEYQDRATPHETSSEARGELYEYFAALMEERRREPKDDLVSVLVHAEVEGRPLTDLEILVWCNLLVVAGNETTRNAATGGMQALIERPEALRRLQAEPDMIKTAVEEIVRWTSPVVHFARTATQDVELRGERIREGDHVALFYPSANRDEEVFDAPFEFRVDRHPNRHLAFGVGEHFCLGAHLARLELECLLRVLLPRIDHAELADEPERLYSSVIGGIKHLPIRYRLRPAPA